MLLGRAAEILNWMCRATLTHTHTPHKINYHAHTHALADGILRCPMAPAYVLLHRRRRRARACARGCTTPSASTRPQQPIHTGPSTVRAVPFSGCVSRSESWAGSRTTTTAAHEKGVQLQLAVDPTAVCTATALYRSDAYRLVAPVSVASRHRAPNYAPTTCAAPSTAASVDALPPSPRAPPRHDDEDYANAACHEGNDEDGDARGPAWGEPARS